MLRQRFSVQDIYRSKARIVWNSQSPIHARNQIHPSAAVALATCEDSFSDSEPSPIASRPCIGDPLSLFVGDDAVSHLALSDHRLNFPNEKEHRKYWDADKRQETNRSRNSRRQKVAYERAVHEQLERLGCCERLLVPSLSTGNQAKGAKADQHQRPGRG